MTFVHVLWSLLSKVINKLILTLLVHWIVGPRLCHNLWCILLNELIASSSQAEKKLVLQVRESNHLRNSDFYEESVYRDPLTREHRSDLLQFPLEQSSWCGPCCTRRRPCFTGSPCTPFYLLLSSWSSCPHTTKLLSNSPKVKWS